MEHKYSKRSRVTMVPNPQNKSEDVLCFCASSPRLDHASVSLARSRSSAMELQTLSEFLLAISVRVKSPSNNAVTIRRLFSK